MHGVERKLADKKFQSGTSAISIKLSQMIRACFETQDSYNI